MNVKTIMHGLSVLDTASHALQFRKENAPDAYTWATESVARENAERPFRSVITPEAARRHIDDAVLQAWGERSDAPISDVFDELKPDELKDLWLLSITDQAEAGKLMKEAIARHVAIELAEAAKDYQDAVRDEL